MSNRTSTFAPAVIAGCVAIFSIITAPAIAEPAAEPAVADECLAAPKATTPAGAHWYYRLEKGTKRKCWYLGDAGAKLKKAATPKSTAAVEDAAPRDDKPIGKSVANARAELAANSPDEDPSLAETTWPPLTPSANAAVRPDTPAQAPIPQGNLTQDNPRHDKQNQHNLGAAIQAAPEPAAAQGGNIASRWPEPTAVASAEDQSNAAAPGANAPAPAQPAPALTPERLAAATPAPTATPAAGVQPATVTETADNESFSIRILLALLVCALALAAIMGPMIFKYIRPRRREEQRAPSQRRPIWDMDISGETIRQDDPPIASPALYDDYLPAPRVLDDEAADEIEQLLARASKRSAA